MRPGVEGQRGELRGRADAAKEIGREIREIPDEGLRGVDRRAQPRPRTVDADDGRAAADERRLVAVRHRSDERRDLLAERWEAHLLHTLVTQRLFDRPQPAGSRQAVALAGEPENEWRAGTAHGAQRHSGAEAEPGRGMPCELASACGLGRRAVDRREHE